MFEYDVAISFAGEQRAEARQIAEYLRNRGYKLFFDEYEQASLWGKNLQEHLADVYERKAQYCLMLVSRDYVNKVWTSHERRSAQARAVAQKAEYILPVRFDDSEVPGLPHTVGYLDFNSCGAERISELLIEKLVGSASGAPPAAALGGTWYYAEERGSAKNQGTLFLFREGRFAIQDSAGITLMRGVWEWNPAAQQLILHDPDPYAAKLQIGFRAELKPSGAPSRFAGTARWPPGGDPWQWQITRGA